MGGNPEKYFFLVSIFLGGDSKFYVIVISQVPMAVFLTLQYEAPFSLLVQQVQCFYRNSVPKKRSFTL